MCIICIFISTFSSKQLYWMFPASFSDVDEKVASDAHLELGVAQLPIAVHIDMSQPALHLDTGHSNDHFSFYWSPFYLHNSKLFPNKFTSSLGLSPGQISAAIFINNGKHLPTENYYLFFCQVHFTVNHQHSQLISIYCLLGENVLVILTSPPISHRISSSLISSASFVSFVQPLSRILSIIVWNTQQITGRLSQSYPLIQSSKKAKN